MVAMSSQPTATYKTSRTPKLKKPISGKTKQVSRTPNIRGIESRARELIAPLIKDASIGKVISLLDKLKNEYIEIQKGFLSKAIVDKAENKCRMVALRASYKLSKL